MLAADCWYESGLATRMVPWLARAHDQGIDVLLGDPGRRYLPRHGFIEQATYEVRTTTELEDMGQKHARVLALPPVSRPGGDT